MEFPNIVKDSENKLIEYIKTLNLETLSFSEDKISTDLLLETFVHKSFSADYNNTVAHNERLEFLWDGILWAIINELLFTNNPAMKESIMTLYKIALVREQTLADVAQDISLWDYIFISKWEVKADWRNKNSILSDALEALIGFIFLSFGFDTAKEFIQKYVYSKFEDLQNSTVKSAKTALQEYIQKHYKQIPEYKDTEHEVETTWNVTKYKSEIYISGVLEAEGFWKNKKSAQTDAAEKLLKKYKVL